MDPNETLKQIREAVHRIGNEWPDSITAGDAVDLAQKVQALDEWLTRGGFRPEDWRTY